MSLYPSCSKEISNNFHPRRNRTSRTVKGNSTRSRIAGNPESCPSPVPFSPIEGQSEESHPLTREQLFRRVNSESAMAGRNKRLAGVEIDPESFAWRVAGSASIDLRYSPFNPYRSPGILSPYFFIIPDFNLRFLPRLSSPRARTLFSCRSMSA